MAKTSVHMYSLCMVEKTQAVLDSDERLVTPTYAQLVREAQEEWRANKGG